MSADLAELFPGIDLGSTSRNGGCTAPIGRKRGRRAQPALRRYRPPSAMLMMLADLRTQLSDGFAKLEIILKQMASDTARSAGRGAALAEAVDQLRVRITSLERAVGTVEAPVIPRHTRRRPLG
jgi:hypothetical protein